MAAAVKPRLADKRASSTKAKTSTAKTTKSGDEIWDELLASPESDAFLKKLSAQAHQDYLDGNVEPGGFGDGVEE
jgi:hypothetical protein